MAQHPGPGGGGKPSKGAGYPSYSGDVSGGYYYTNLLRIAQFLMSNGYNRTAAAGIAGTIAGESSGDPDVGNAMGILQWTPPSKAAPDQPIYTGQPQADFDAQLTDMLEYNNTNGPVDQLKSFKGSPVEAANFYSQTWERPAVTDSDVRASVADNIYSALKNYTPNSAYTEYPGSGVNPGVGKGLHGTAPSTGDYAKALYGDLLTGEGTISEEEGRIGGDIAHFFGDVTGLTAIADAIITFAAPFAKMAEGLDWFFAPSHWIRIFAGIGGIGFLGFGVYSMGHVGRGGQVGGSVAGVPVGVDLPSSNLPIAIGATGLGFLGLFIAFHSLPSSVKTFPDFLGYLSSEARKGTSDAVSGSSGAS